MAKLIASSVNIGGTEIKQFSSFVLTQKIFSHHQFKMICPSEAIEGYKGALFSKSRNLMGETITVTVNDVTGGNSSLQFSGLVTQVEAARFSGHVGDVIISGYCPTIVLDSGPHCNTWEKKALNNIAKDVLGHFSEHVKSPIINPAYGETFSYTVQYKETAWQFLGRMASTYGEWLFYNGQNLVFGQPKGKSGTLIFGRDLSHFNIELQLRPPNFQQMARDYVNDQIYDTIPTGIEAKAGLNELGKFVYGKSKEFFASQPKYWNNRFLTNKKQLEDNANFRAAAQSTNMVRFFGTSNNQSVQLGNKVTVKGMNQLTMAEEEYGDYSIIEVTHQFDSQGNYSNDFTAIPGTIKIPPVPGYPEPVIETQSAIVTDNHDPGGLGRVRVKFHWMKGSQKTPWIRVTSPHGGGGKGMFFIPELDEEVIIGFEGDSAVKPYVIGTVYHGKANTSFSNGGNDVKALQTRSGNKVVMNDNAGSVFVEDKDGNSMMYDGAGNITVKANKKIELLCGKSTITMLEDGTITINGKDIFIDGTDSSNISSGKTSGIVIKPSTLDAGSTTTTISGKTELNAGGAKVNVGGGAEVNVSSGKISMN
jgi:type VI secretion system secreted protein VgrG